MFRQFERGYAVRYKNTYVSVLPSDFGRVLSSYAEGRNDHRTGKRVVTEEELIAFFKKVGARPPPHLTQDTIIRRGYFDLNNLNRRNGVVHVPVVGLYYDEIPNHIDLVIPGVKFVRGEHQERA